MGGRYRFIFSAYGILRLVLEREKLGFKIISIGIIIVMLVASIVLFDKIRVSDILFAVLTGFILFKN